MQTYFGSKCDLVEFMLVHIFVPDHHYVRGLGGFDMRHPEPSSPPPVGLDCLLRSEVRARLPHKNVVTKSSDIPLLSKTLRDQ